MNRTLTAAAALVASSAGAVGFAGIATADPAPELPAAPPALHGVDNSMGILHTVTRSVGDVVPAQRQWTSRSADGNRSRGGLPLVGQLHGTALDPVVQVVGGSSRSADSAGAAERNAGLGRSALGGVPASVIDAVPLRGGSGSLAGRPGVQREPTVNPMATVRSLLSTVGQVNLLEQH